MGRIDVKVGYSCNDACVHCVVDDFRDVLRQKRSRQDKTTADLRAELADGRQRGSQVVITGGEPTIRKDLPELLTYARELGYQVLVQSNGRGFANPDLADHVAGLGHITACIALHGPTAQVHDAVTARPGSFDQTVAGIRNLVDRGVPVSGKVVLSQVNYRVLPDTCRTLAELGVCQVSIAFPHALGRARKLWDQVVPRYRDVLPYVHEAIRLLSRAGVSSDAETFTFCHMQGLEQHVCEIQQQLSEYVELNQYGSDAGKQNWSQVRWEIKTKFPQCRGCRFDAVCEGPWTEYAEVYGGEEFTPVYGAPVRHVREILDGRFRLEFPGLAELPA